MAKQKPSRRKNQRRQRRTVPSKTAAEDTSRRALGMGRKSRDTIMNQPRPNYRKGVGGNIEYNTGRGIVTFLNKVLTEVDGFLGFIATSMPVEHDDGEATVSVIRKETTETYNANHEQHFSTRNLLNNFNAHAELKTYYEELPAAVLYSKSPHNRRLVDATIREKGFQLMHDIRQLALCAAYAAGHHFTADFQARQFDSIIRDGMVFENLRLEDIIERDVRTFASAHFTDDDEELVRALFDEMYNSNFMSSRRVARIIPHTIFTRLRNRFIKSGTSETGELTARLKSQDDITVFASLNPIASRRSGSPHGGDPSMGSATYGNWWVAGRDVDLTNWPDDKPIGAAYDMMIYSYIEKKYVLVTYESLLRACMYEPAQYIEKHGFGADLNNMQHLPGFVLGNPPAGRTPWGQSRGANNHEYDQGNPGRARYVVGVLRRGTDVPEDLYDLFHHMLKKKFDTAVTTLGRAAAIGAGNVVDDAVFTHVGFTNDNIMDDAHRYAFQHNNNAFTAAYRNFIERIQYDSFREMLVDLCKKHNLPPLFWVGLDFHTTQYLTGSSQLCQPKITALGVSDVFSHCKSTDRAGLHYHISHSVKMCAAPITEQNCRPKYHDVVVRPVRAFDPNRPLKTDVTEYADARAPVDLGVARCYLIKAGSIKGNNTFIPHGKLPEQIVFSDPPHNDTERARRDQLRDALEQKLIRQHATDGEAEYLYKEARYYKPMMSLPDRPTAPLSHGCTSEREHKNKVYPLSILAHQMVRSTQRKNSMWEPCTGYGWEPNPSRNVSDIMMRGSMQGATRKYVDYVE